MIFDFARQVAFVLKSCELAVDCFAVFESKAGQSLRNTSTGNEPICIQRDNASAGQAKSS
jgi:hypothetical protein